MSSMISKLFGGTPAKQKHVFNPTEIKQDPAVGERDRILKEFAKRRRATMTSELSQARIGRNKLGAGV